MKLRSAYLHLLIWFLILFYENAEELLSGSADLHGFLLNGFHIAAHAAAFYTTFLLLTSHNGRVSWRIGVSILSGLIIFIPVRLFLQEVMLVWITGEGNYRAPWQIAYVYDNFYRPFPTVMIAIILFIVRKQQHSKQKEAEWAKAELAHLRGQIHPHFLFNTLGYVHNKVVVASPEAATVVLELSKILRAGLDQSSLKPSLSTLRNELELVHSLHAIMQHRFDGTCYLKIEADERLLDTDFEPLVLLSLMENMFKHGNLRNPEKPGILRIFKNSRLIIETCNLVQEGAVPHGTGIGLRNIRKRMELLHGDQFSLTAQRNNQYFEVTLKIPEG